MRARALAPRTMLNRFANPLASTELFDPVTGTFSGLPEGSLVTVGSFSAFISSRGGDGNDVVLALPPSEIDGWIGELRAIL